MMASAQDPLLRTESFARIYATFGVRTSVIVSMIVMCWFPAGEIGSLTMHGRTWGTDLSIVASCIAEKHGRLSFETCVPSEEY